MTYPSRLLSLIWRQSMQFLFLGVVAVLSGAIFDAQASEERYQYRLEQSHNDMLCRHMTDVFNGKFQEPWDKGHLSNENVPSFHGKPFDQLFDRLPSVPFDPMVTWDMLLTIYPSSPEFDAIKWKEGRICQLGGNSSSASCKHLSPMLFTEIDIDNDGVKEWLVKDTFIDSITAYEGNWDGGWDSLTIFRQDDFDEKKQITSYQMFYGQRVGAMQPRVLDRNVALQLRPFIFKEKTYLSAYQTEWHGSSSKERESASRHYPDREYMNILRVIPGGKHLYNQVIETANTETICRIRMLMQPSAEKNGE